MASPIFGAPLTVMEGETRVLSTTADYIAVEPNFHEVKMYCATQWRLSLSPALLHVVYYSAASTSYQEYKTEATDKSSATHVPLDAMATTDCLYLGSSDPVLGYYFDIGTNVQDNAATLDVAYSSTAVPGTLAFTNVTGDSDGTNSVADTLKVDGVYVWTLPTAWVRTTLGTADHPRYSKCYWIRIMPSATLSATVDINEIIPVYQNASYGYMEPGIEYQFSFSTTRCGGFVVKATAGTPALDISWVSHD